MRRFKQADHGERGWYVGPWANAVYRTDLFEVAHGFNPAGDVSPAHTHRVATEINLITTGRVLVSGQEFKAGEGFIMEPGDVCEVIYLEDTCTLCIKTPAVTGDKYYV